MAVDYADTLVDLEAMNADTNYPLKVMRAEQPLSPDSLTHYNATDFLWFRIDVSESYKAALADHNDEQAEVHIEINEYHKRRRDAFPERLGLKEE